MFEIHGPNGSKGPKDNDVFLRQLSSRNSIDCRHALEEVEKLVASLLNLPLSSSLTKDTETSSALQTSTYMR
ncbi:hypothetical protein CCR75_007711 [Bremia lactucae]|uniref:Uncharacterized protein n=1 Tax=Bremia lactucae TaxID=4779 RepID=A0A976FMT3_BRELC|nr:hypothetical protein CCR75_007711 [Bremia lactucae]